MKKILSVLTAVLTVCMMLCATMPVSAASSTATLSASSTKPTVNSTVTITVKLSADKAIASLQGNMTYDASVLEYVSTADGVTANGGAGVLNFSWFDYNTAAKTRSFKVTFKAKAAGSSAVKFNTTELCDGDINDLGYPTGSVTVNVQNPQKSGNADLKSLYISSGSLSPAFSAKVTAYSIVIPYDVTVLTVSAVAADGNATISVEGSKNMKVGKNTRVVKVTAPNGTVKSYTLNITRQESNGNPDKDTDGETPPADTAAQVTVGDETLYIATDLKDVTLPVGYEQASLTVSDVEFPSVQDKNRNVTLLYLTDKDGKNGAFYVYDTAAMTFSAFCHVTAPAGVYAFLTPDSNLVIPEGFTQAFVEINGQTVSAFAFPQPEMAAYYLVYALSPAGNKGLYTYDTEEGTLQRYTHAAAVSVPAEEQPLEEPDENGGFVAKVKGVYQSLLNRFGGVRLALLAGGAVVLIAALVVLIVLLCKRPRDCKH